MKNSYYFKRSENQVVKSICDYLKIKRYFFWRQNNVGVWDNTKKVYRKSYYGIKGVPDIFVLKDGRIYGVECKSESGGLSLNQKMYRELFCDAGGIYIIAKSIKDVVEGGL